MTARRIAMAVGAVLALLMAWRMVRDELRLHAGGAAGGAGEGARSAAADEQARAPAGGRDRPLGSYRAGARTPLPRFRIAPPDATPPPAPGAGPRLAGPGEKPPRSRFAEDPPDLARMQALVKERLKEMHERADRCMQGWSAPDPTLEKGVMLAIEIEPGGLQQVWIEDLVEIPSGPLSCLSDAVYQLDWSGIVQQPMKITSRQRYQAGDAGSRD